MSELVVTQTSLTYAGARVALDAALDRAAEIGVAVNVSVCDVAGHQLAFARMDGAPLLSGPIAVDKAYSVAAFGGLPTSRWFGLIEDDPALREGIVHRDRLVIFGGGVPVVHEGVRVGAVGVSGGSAEQDEEVATAGATALH
jgi:glc operon protein GlcG